MRWEANRHKESNTGCYDQQIGREKRNAGHFDRRSNGNGARKTAESARGEEDEAEDCQTGKGNI